MHRPQDSEYRVNSIPGQLIRREIIFFFGFVLTLHRCAPNSALVECGFQEWIEVTRWTRSNYTFPSIYLGR